MNKTQIIKMKNRLDDFKKELRDYIKSHHSTVFLPQQAEPYFLTFNAICEELKDTFPTIFKKIERPKIPEFTDFKGVRAINREQFDLLLYEIESYIIKVSNLFEANETVQKFDINIKDPVVIIKNLCIKFHSVALQLKKRCKKKSTLEINAECDVQDLMHALLRLFFDDVRREEPVPSHAGMSARMDLYLPEEKIGIEIKFLNEAYNAKRIANDLIVDIERYKNHPNCEILICFIYDPKIRIRNPIELKDLEKREDLRVYVFINPTSTNI